MVETNANSGDWSLIDIEVPPSRIDAAIEHPDALQIAYDVGVLELLSISLAILGVALIVLSFGAYFSIQRAAKRSAAEIARKHVPEAVEGYIRGDSFAILKAVLKNPETLAELSAAMDKLGILDVTDAGNVEGTILETLNDAKADREAR